jgi:hypothetical protein
LFRSASKQDDVTLQGQSEIPGDRMLDLCHLVALQVGHWVALDIAGIDRPDLID